MSEPTIWGSDRLDPQDAVDSGRRDRRSFFKFSRGDAAAKS
jgi:hypothetical protein